LRNQRSYTAAKVRSRVVLRARSWHIAGLPHERVRPKCAVRGSRETGEVLHGKATLPCGARTGRTAGGKVCSRVRFAVRPFGPRCRNTASWLIDKKHLIDWNRESVPARLPLRQFRERRRNRWLELGCPSRLTLPVRRATRRTAYDVRLTPRRAPLCPEPCIRIAWELWFVG